jgi:quinol monooxygenase YgiN
MWRSTSIVGGLLGLALLGGVACRTTLPPSRTDPTRRYLRVTTARWDIDLYSTEAERMFRQINTEGVAVFRAQPGFVRYRLMRADRTTTVAVAEWESEALGKAGAERYREWMRHVGIMAHLTLETHAGEIVAGS